MVAAEEKVGPPLVATKQAEEQSSHREYLLRSPGTAVRVSGMTAAPGTYLCSDRLC